MQASWTSGANNGRPVAVASHAADQPPSIGQLPWEGVRSRARECRPVLLRCNGDAILSPPQRRLFQPVPSTATNAGLRGGPLSNWLK